MASRIPTNTKLKNIVTTLRSYKTAKEERAFVAKECAEIRSAFKNGSQHARCVALTKLLYFHILGYPANFGQIECIKLIASNRYVDKRIGYMGCMMLLDENTEILVMITNCLRKDLDQPSEDIQSLALCTLAAICSQDMARMLSVCVERPLKSGSQVVKKKAALCACRLIAKVPEVIDMFLPYVAPLLSDKCVGINLCGCTLATTICETDETKIAKIKEYNIISHLLKRLSHLLMYGCKPQHTVHGVPNPYLQVKILRLLSWLGRKDAEVSNSMIDILAKTITNTSFNTSASCSIIYEACLTVFKIEAPDDLTSLAVNMLGEFLHTHDRNVKYVAMSIMQQISSTHPQLVQRHQNHIFQCINEEDPALKKRALEVVFYTITAANLVDSIDRLVQYLFVCDDSCKQFVTNSIVTTLEKFPSDEERHIRILIDLLETASYYIRDDAVSTFIALVSNCSDSIRKATVIRLFENLSTKEQPVLASVVCWVIGEYGHLYLTGKQIKDKLCDVVLHLKNTMFLHRGDDSTRNIALLAMMKLAARIPEIEREINEIVHHFVSNIDPELQQRSIEWESFSGMILELRKKLFEPMPPLPIRNAFVPLPNTTNAANNKSQSIIMDSTQKENLLDFFDIPVETVDPNQGNGDISSTQLVQTISQDRYNFDIYDKNGVKIYITCNDSLSDGIVYLKLHAKNSSNNLVSNLLCQLSFPVIMTSQIDMPSTTQLFPNNANEMCQLITLNNPQKTKVKLRVKISYTTGEKNFEEIVHVNELSELKFL